MESSTLMEQNSQNVRNEKLIILTDKHINNVFRNSQSIERLIDQSNIKIKSEVINNLQELRVIIQSQALKLSGHV